MCRLALTPVSMYRFEKFYLAIASFRLDVILQFLRQMFIFLISKNSLLYGRSCYFFVTKEQKIDTFDGCFYLYKCKLYYDDGN
jgi:hypothetical protein